MEEAMDTKTISSKKLIPANGEMKDKKTWKTPSVAKLAVKKNTETSETSTGLDGVLTYS